MKRKMISWGLVLMLLFNVAFSGVNVLAEEQTTTEAGQTGQAVVTTASPAGAQLLPQGNDVSAKLKNVEAELLQDEKPVSPNGTLDQNKPFQIKAGFDVPVLGDGISAGDAVQKGDKATITLAEGLQLKEETSFELREGLKIGTVTLRQSGNQILAEVVFDGDDDIYNGNSSDVKGQFEVNFEALSSGSGQNDTTVAFGVLGKSYNLKLVDIEYVLKKEGALDLKNRLVNWKITVELKDKNDHNNFLDLEGYTLIDDLFSNESRFNAGQYVDNSFKVEDENGTDKTDPANLNKKFEDPQDSSKVTKLDYTFPQGSVGKQVITLQTALTAEEANPQKHVSVTNKYNEARLYFKTDQAEKAKDGRLLTATGKEWIQKWGGAPDKVNTTFEWTITLNQEKERLEDVVVTDVLQAGMTFVSARLMKNGQVEKEWSDQPNDSKYELGTLDGEAQLIIKVKVERQNHEFSRNFKNLAEVTWKDNPSPFKRTADYTFKFVDNIEKDLVGGRKSDSARNWEQAAIRWKIKVHYAALKEMQIPRVFDLMIYDKVNAPKDSANRYQLKGLETFTLTAEGRQALGIQDDVAMRNFMQNLKPIYHDYLKYVDGSFKPLSGLEQGEITTFPVQNADGVTVGDLVMVSGPVKDGEDWEFILEAAVTDPYIMYIQPKGIDINNTAQLFDGTAFKGEARVSIADYKSRMLEKELLDEAQAEEFRNAPTAVLANSAKTTNPKKGYHYSDNTVLYRISINGDNHQYLDLALGQNVQLKDVLPEGWEFVSVNEQADYLIFKGETINFNTDNLSVTAKGEAISGKWNEAVPGLDWLAKKSTEIERNGTSHQKAEIVMGKAAAPYVVVLAARPTEAKLKEYLTKGGIPVMENKAVLRGDNTPDALFRTQKVEFDVRLLNKEVVSLGGVLEWTISYTPKNFPVPVEKAVLEDALSEGMNLRMRADGSLDLENAFFLYEVTPAGSKRISLVEGQDITYNAATRTLTLNLPDKQKSYRFTYLTDITGREGTKVNNKVNLKGIGNNAQSAEKEYKIQTIDGSGSYIANAWIEVRKVDEAGKPLAGAEFRLTSPDAAPRTLTTGVTGFIKFNHLLDANGTRIYTLKETKAPAGYLLNETEYTIVVERESATKVKVSINGVETREIRVVNKKKPVEPGDNTPLKPYDPDGGNDIPPLTPPTPPTKIEDNPVPEGSKTIPKVPEVPLTHEIPEGVPELPKTDGVPTGAFSLFGLALAVLGLLFKRSK
ncbi:hypothetical protein C3V36_03535 [Lachnospiraceae bacterium oral taxon 500]|nr:hypothetical protein C3V36_03535 [Lachnospiraceae bacterium oral taxon 500]